MSLKHLSNYWRTLDIPLINCERNHILTWSENCIIISKATRNADSDAGPAVAAVNNPTNAKFKTTDTKLYVSLFTLSTEDGNKLLEQLKAGFKETFKWNKYRSGLGFFYFCRTLRNAKEKPTRKTCFSREMKRLALPFKLLLGGISLMSTEFYCNFMRKIC